MWPVASTVADLSAPLAGDAAGGQPGEHLRGRRGGHAQSRGARRAVPDLRAEQRRFHGDGHRPGHLPGDRAATRPGSTRSMSCPATTCAPCMSTNDLGNSLTPINPVTGRPAGPNIPVDDPYNMYFTPDGRYADRRRRSPPGAGLPRPAHVRARTPDHGRLRGRGPHRLRGQRGLPDRHLRVRRPPGPGRPAHPEGRRLPRPAGLGAAGHQAGSRRAHLLRRRQEPRRGMDDRRRRCSGQPGPGRPARTLTA